MAFATATAYARNIDGLNYQQSEDLNKCLRYEGFDFNQINTWGNNASMFERTDEKWPLFHNFVMRLYDIDTLGESKLSNAIFTGGLYVENIVPGPDDAPTGQIDPVPFQGSQSPCLTLGNPICQGQP